MLCPVTRPRILVADDEPLIRTLLQRSLEDTYDVVCVGDGGQALALLRAGGKFDAVLCDLSMPVVGGALVYFETALLAPQQARRFIFLSGGATAESDRALLEGLDRRRLEKPFSLAALRSAVAGVVAGEDD